uniref:Conotoxin Cl14.8 n=1 Tax=Californiconus californicus TaxID=1736779 RepID=CLE8_CONCL
MKLSVTFIALMLTMTLTQGFVLQAIDGRDNSGLDDLSEADSMEHQLQRRDCGRCPLGQYCDAEAGMCKPTLIM